VVAVFGLLTLMLLAVLFRTAAPEARGTGSHSPSVTRRAEGTLATAIARERRLA
jgi:hypothetical protein